MLNNISIYEDNLHFYIRKQDWIPTTFWKEKCFLEYLFSTENIKKYENLKTLKNNFTQKQEFWLLNRLDNDTSWILYFAKNISIYEKFKQLQKNSLINKVYIADVIWKFEEWLSKINFPIMHKKWSNKKMICIKSNNQIKHWKWKMHYVETNIEFLYYDNSKNISTLKIVINKWIRHQIRAHLSSIWFPIIWDSLYNKNTTCKKLHLFSIWIFYDRIF